MSDEEAKVDASLQPLSSQPLPSNPSRREPVLAALEAGERGRAAALLLDEHGMSIGRTCMALLGSQSEAEDALQETLIAALDGLTTFRGEGSLRAWLLSIARRGCAKRLEARFRERELKQSVAAPEPLASAERLSMAARARRLLEEIRPTERDALVLRFAGELSFREVAEACGIDEAAARKRVSRGLARLRSLLGEDKQ